MIEFVDWGNIPYLKAQERQLDLVEKVAAHLLEDHIVFCSHPEVVTLGRGTRTGDVFSFSGDIIEVSRGGRATYHGPNQLVIYPILDLKKERVGCLSKDLHGLMRALETAMVQALKGWGVSAQGHQRARLVGEDRDVDATGVWVGNKKIASIGIAVRKWVSYHGLAINVFRDEKAFRGMHPCGFKKEVMTDVESELGSAMNLDLFKKSCRKYLAEYLSCKDK